MNFIKEKNKAWYDSLTEANVESLVLFPLKSGYELLGYIWANNFDTEKTMHIKETLELTTFFLASEISSYQMFDKFRILSTVDMLTGVLNRNEMNNRVMQLGIDDRPGRKNIGIVFADLNGLKTMNDNNGHSAGDKLIKDVVSQHTDYPYVLLDSTHKEANKYNVQVQGDLVCVMSKNLTEFKGNYASITKLDAVSSRFLLEQLNQMVNEEMYSLFFEDALVQMIFQKNFELYYKDIKDYKWTEVDCVDDLLKARQIQVESEK